MRKLERLQTWRSEERGVKLPFAGLSFWLRRVLLELVARKADWGDGGWRATADMQVPSEGMIDLYASSQ